MEPITKGFYNSVSGACFDNYLTQQEEEKIKKEREEEIRLHEEKIARERKEYLDKKYKEQNGDLKVEFARRFANLCNEFGLSANYLSIEFTDTEEDLDIFYDIHDDEIKLMENGEETLKVGTISAPKSAHEKLELQVRRQKILEGIEK